MTIVARHVALQWRVGMLSCHPRNVVVVTAEQHGTRRRAKWGGMKLAEPNPLARQCIDVRGPDIAAKNTQVCIAQVICND